MAESPRPRQAGEERRARSVAVLLSCLSCWLVSCAISQGGPDPAPRGEPVAAPTRLRHQPLDPAHVQVAPGPITVEDSWILDAYTLLHRRNYATFRVRLPPEHEGDSEAVAHLLVPPGTGPHPALIVFPILAGTHVVSEALAKGLVRRGYVVLRMERRVLLFEEAKHPEDLSRELSTAVRNGRRALDWLEARPEVDPRRIGAAGVSLGGMLACLLHELDPRVRAGFFALTGGGMPELLYDSSEVPVREFRDRMMQEHGLADRDAFLSWIEPQVYWLDPVRYASQVDPARVLMVSGRFDRVVPRERSDELWQALGRPPRLVLPSGHYQTLPFLWHATARAADHFDRALAPLEAAESVAERSSGR